MSERDFYDEESLQKYRAYLIDCRNQYGSDYNNINVKIINERLKSLPEHYPNIPEQINNKPNEQAFKNNFTREKFSFKEKTRNTLGGFGVVCLFLLRILIAIIPFVMIGGNFFLTLFLVSINYFIPITSVVFWIWGLVCAIQGVQDIWAIIFYISFVIIWIPFFISTIKSVFLKN